MNTNQIIHKWMGRGCWHQAGHYVGESTLTFICMHCGLQKVPVECLGPKYTADLNAIHEAEMKAGILFGFRLYSQTIQNVALSLGKWTPTCITASAEVRAAAVVKLIELSGVTGGAEDAGHAIA